MYPCTIRFLPCKYPSSYKTSLVDELCPDRDGTGTVKNTVNMRFTGTLNRPSRIAVRQYSPHDRGPRTVPPERPSSSLVLREKRKKLQESKPQAKLRRSYRGSNCSGLL